MTGPHSPHGTPARYNYGCHCKKCRAAIAAYHQAHTEPVT